MAKIKRKFGVDETRLRIANSTGIAETQLRFSLSRGGREHKVRSASAPPIRAAPGCSRSARRSRVAERDQLHIRTPVWTRSRRTTRFFARQLPRPLIHSAHCFLISAMMRANRSRSTFQGPRCEHPRPDKNQRRGHLAGMLRFSVARPRRPFSFSNAPVAKSGHISWE
jgi:hypothetical protein